ncbi:phosphoserine phosphatase SerB [Sphingorhabdus soli]|uniref:Phosphoserine phosphatase n=1 Tax=Flavisphingopyxis soli TaxID=2601267 RepID=A0A5C6U845_9SPHN|nr:phosphoserine phosphatase SerB [Sphingorhabdus soli]TXC68989.1 phosphoserine phosphatase SerB [Sphingorhabdus soli]
MFIATVIAARRLNENAIDRVEQILAQAGCEPAGWRWIDEGDAADVEFRQGLVNARAALRDAVEGCDIVVQAAIGREKAILISDMDSTMIGQECIDELADLAGVGREVAAVTERAMRGEIDFVGALNDRVALLAGLPVGKVAECLATRIHDTPGAQTLVRTMRARGALTILVSGGFRRFAGPVAQRLGFERVHCNVLGAADGCLMGKVEGPIVDAAAKLAALEQACVARGVDRTAVLAIGDGANDLPMIEAAGLGVAFNAKPIVAAAAAAAIAHNDLTALLWVQGISRAHWIEG